jgi:hypothetical protein
MRSRLSGAVAAGRVQFTAADQFSFSISGLTAAPNKTISLERVTNFTPSLAGLPFLGIHSESPSRSMLSQDIVECYPRSLRSHGGVGNCVTILLARSVQSD